MGVFIESRYTNASTINWIPIERAQTLINVLAGQWSTKQDSFPPGWIPSDSI
jgi:hypothetical protein